MSPTTKNFLEKIRREQTRIYGAVDRKIEAIHEHRNTQGLPPPRVAPPDSAGPLEKITAANYVIQAASVVIDDMAAQALASGALSREDRESIRHLTSRQRDNAARVATWAADPRWREESTSAIREAVSAEVGVLLELEALMRSRTGERASIKTAADVGRW